MQVRSCLPMRVSARDGGQEAGSSLARGKSTRPAMDPSRQTSANIGKHRQTTVNRPSPDSPSRGARTLSNLNYCLLHHILLTLSSWPTWMEGAR